MRMQEVRAEHEAAASAGLDEWMARAAGGFWSFSVILRFLIVAPEPRAAPGRSPFILKVELPNGPRQTPGWGFLCPQAPLPPLN